MRGACLCRISLAQVTIEHRARRFPQPALCPAQPSLFSTYLGASRGVDHAPPLQSIKHSSKQVERSRTSKYMQWGKLRHQYVGSELRSARRSFNWWKENYPSVLQRPPQQRSWRAKAAWLLECGSVAAMRTAWHKLDEGVRIQDWPSTMLSAMCQSPQKAAAVLEATLDPSPPGYAMNDVLYFVAQNLPLDQSDDGRRRTIIEAEGTMTLLRRLIAGCPQGHIPFEQRVLGLLAKKLPSDHAQELYVLLRKSGIRLHANTRIHFASKLAKDPAHKGAAFEILQMLSDLGADLNEARPSSVITSLLHCKVPDRGTDAQQQSSHFSVRDALRELIERGFRLNVLSATAFLDTLCQQGEVEEAIRLASLFSESGLQLDSKSWATIFRGARNSLEMDHVVKAFELAKVANVPAVDVLNSGLHHAFYLSELERRDKNTPEAAQVPVLFGPLLRLYARKFHLEPLQWWLPDVLPLALAKDQNEDADASHQTHGDGASRTRWNYESTILPFLQRMFSADREPKLQPSSTTIAIMLRAYIRSLRDPHDLVTYYQFFKGRLESDRSGREGASLSTKASRLIEDQGSLIHDTLILAMTERGVLPRPALQIFGDMLRDQRRTSEGPEAAAMSRPIHPAPTIFTFTILLRGLMEGYDRILANQIVDMMHDLGIKPNLVTWNTLLKGFARAQRMAKTVTTLQDMEAAGFKPDMYTFKAFSLLKNQNQALEFMEALINANEQHGLKHR